MLDHRSNLASPRERLAWTLNTQWALDRALTLAQDTGSATVLAELLERARARIGRDGLGLGLDRKQRAWDRVVVVVSGSGSGSPSLEDCQRL